MIREHCSEVSQLHNDNPRVHSSLGNESEKPFAAQGHNSLAPPLVSVPSNFVILRGGGGEGEGIPGAGKT